MSSHDLAFYDMKTRYMRLTDEEIASLERFLLSMKDLSGEASKQIVELYADRSDIKHCFASKVD